MGLFQIEKWSQNWRFREVLGNFLVSEKGSVVRTKSDHSVQRLMRIQKALTEGLPTAKWPAG
jgi:hypothetical protein